MSTDTSGNAYRAREVELLEQLAVATLSDPKASGDDRAAARERLENTGKEFDFRKLSPAELGVLDGLIRTAKSESMSDLYRASYAQSCAELAEKVCSAIE